MDTPTTFAGLALKMAPGTDSGYKNVTKNGKLGWQSRTGPKNARRHIGTFATKVEAAVAVVVNDMMLNANGINKEDHDPHYLDSKLEPATLTKLAGTSAVPRPSPALSSFSPAL